MRHTDDEIEQASHRFGELTDALDPDIVQSEDLEDLTVVAAASATVRADEDRLRHHRGRRQSEKAVLKPDRHRAWCLPTSRPAAICRQDLRLSRSWMAKEAGGPPRVSRLPASPVPSESAYPGGTGHRSSSAAGL